MSSSIKVGMGMENRRILQNNSRPSSQCSGLRLRINRSRIIASQSFLDIRYFEGKNFLLGWGISRSGADWFGFLNVEGQNRDAETPELWINNVNSVSLQTGFYKFLKRKVLSSITMAGKRYVSDSAYFKGDRFTMETALDFPLLGRAGISAGSQFDQYQNLLPRSIDQSLFIGLFYLYEKFNGSYRNTQNLRINLSLPFNPRVGMVVRSYAGSNLISGAPLSTKIRGGEIVTYFFFSRKTGFFLNYRIQKHNELGFDTSNRGFEITLHSNF
ncbi:MAG: hypothetical protein ABIA63_12410 [bacterium]